MDGWSPCVPVRSIEYFFEWFGSLGRLRCVNYNQPMARPVFHAMPIRVPIALWIYLDFHRFVRSV